MPKFIKSCVASLNPRVTSPNTRVWRIKARVTRLKIRIRRLKAHVRRLNVRVEAIKPIKSFSSNVNFTCELKPCTKQTGGAHISTSTWLWKVSMWSLSYHQILTAGKVESIVLNKTWLEGTIIISLMWDHVTEIKLIIIGWVWPQNMESK